MLYAGILTIYQKNHATENHAVHFALIAGWAKEIEKLASLEAELEKGEQQEIRWRK